MFRKGLLLLTLQCIGLMATAWGQRTPYSLQAAVDEMHRREAAKFPLNAPPPQQLYFGALGSAPEQDYWDDDTEFQAYSNRNRDSHRRRLNKALAKYLEHEKYEADHGGLTLGPFGGWEFDADSNILPQKKQKRTSLFREREHGYDGNSAPSVFRERDIHALNSPDQAELTQQFLNEIEESQERERENHYNEALRHLWDKYQKQEDEIQDDLFQEKKKRMRGPPYYMLMQKKRSYPVLPWLPYEDRRKRFPVSKRSTKRASAEDLSFGKTDEKVARELSELFGEENDEKRKRSTDVQPGKPSSSPPSTHAPTTSASTAIVEMRLEVPTKKDNVTTELPAKSAATAEDSKGEHQHRAQKQHKHRKRSDHSRESHEDEEYSEEEHTEHGDHEEHDSHESEEEFDEEEEEERKKKRSVKRAVPQGEIFKPEQVSPDDDYLDAGYAKKKKAVQWSKYFGIDRKKKANAPDLRYPLMLKKRNAGEDNSELEDNRHKKMKRNLNPEKLQNMDRKLQSIEDFIIDETIKYTGSHEGTTNPDEMRRLKDHVLSRLATAYSLEKMRRALEKLRQSVESDNHLLRNTIEQDSHETNELLENVKRLAVKKESAHGEMKGAAADNETGENEHRNAHENTNDDGDYDDDEDEAKRKKKKRGSYLRYPELPNEFADGVQELGAMQYESLNDAYLGNKNYIIGSNQCPLIESMAQRCRGVDILSGDLNQELLPICGVHQICYLCGTSQVACDYQYLAEADQICGNSDECQAAARSVLMILRGAPGQQMGPRECLKNPCLYSAMREIGL